MNKYDFENGVLFTESQMNFLCLLGFQSAL